MIEEEIKVLASMPLTALKPAEAAVELVAYRRFARQWVILCRLLAAETPVRQNNELMMRLNHIHWSERYLMKALGRDLPHSLAKLVEDEELEKSLSEEAKLRASA
ncbi:hypothetical protein D3C72_478150 [compost metagenome]